jgi:pimeloyl-ACP methyl ester carboxylesterase
LIGRLDVEDLQATCEQAASILPGAQLSFLEGVAHLPHLEGDPATLEQIARFVGSFA